jgi:hypothetical protein
LRWIHIAFALPILGYIYGPASEVEPYAPVFRFVFLPAVVLTGFWMWKGHSLRRLLSRGTPGARADGTPLPRSGSTR